MTAAASHRGGFFASREGRGAIRDSGYNQAISFSEVWLTQGQTSENGDVSTVVLKCPSQTQPLEQSRLAWHECLKEQP